MKIDKESMWWRGKCRFGEEKKWAFGLRLLFLWLFLACGVTMSGCFLFPKEEVEDVSNLVQPPPEDNIVTEVVTEGPINEEIPGSAMVRSLQEGNLYFIISGRVREVSVETDEMVKKGQTLVSLETGDLDYSLKLTKIALDQEELRCQMVQYDAGALAKRIAELGVERARLEYEHLQEKLNQSVLRAPFDGKVVEQKAARGKAIEAFDPVVTIIGAKGLELVAEVDSETMRKLSTGMAVKVEMEEGSPQMGHIISIKQPELSKTASGEYNVHIRLDNPRVSLQIDTFHSLLFILRSVKNTLMVPNSAVREDVNGRKYLRVIEGKQRRDVYIRVGIENDTMTQIIEGAKVGMVVVGR